MGGILSSPFTNGLPGFQWVARYRKAYQLKPATFVAVVVVVVVVVIAAHSNADPRAISEEPPAISLPPFAIALSNVLRNRL